MPTISAKEFGARLADLRAQAEKREDSLLVGLTDLLRDVFMEPIPEKKEEEPRGKKKR